MKYLLKSTLLYQIFATIIFGIYFRSFYSDTFFVTYFIYINDINLINVICTYMYSKFLKQIECELLDYQI